METMIWNWRRCFMVLVMAAFLAATVGTGTAGAETGRIVVLNIQKVLATSKSGRQAKGVLEKKMKELQQSFKKEEDELLALQKEIEKKSSAWSDEMREQKAMEFRKKRRALREKQEDASLELKKLKEKQLGPILKDLEQVVKKLAKEKGYRIVLPRESVLHVAPDADITEEVTAALDALKK